MVNIHSYAGRLLARYEKETGIIEIKNHDFFYKICLFINQSFRIESLDSLTVITRTSKTAFTVSSCHKDVA